MYKGFAVLVKCPDLPFYLFLMEKIRLVRLLRKVKKEELDHFYHFVNSPFFDLPEPIRLLFNYLKDLYPDFPKEKWNRKEMYLNSYPDKKYLPRRLNDLMWEACVAMEDYFIVSELKHHPEKRGDLLKEHYRRRNLLTEYENQLDKLVRYYHSNQEVSFEKSVSRLHILNELLFLLKRDTNEMHDATYGNPLQDFEECLHRIRMFGEINLDIFAKGLYAHGAEPGFRYKSDFSNFEESPDSQILTDTPLLMLLYKLRLLYTEDMSEKDLPKLQEVVDMFLAHIDTFSFQETARLYVLLQNVAIKFSMIKKDTWKILFPATKLAVEKGAVGAGKEGFSQLTFTNIVTIGTKIGEFDYVESFIDRFSPLLPPKVYEETRNLALVSLHYNRGNFRDVHLYAGQIEFKDVRYKLNLKSIIIRSYYEMLGEEDTDWVTSILRAQLRSFSKYLKRTKGVPPILSVRYMNFTIIVKKMLVLKLRERRTKQGIEKVRQTLEQHLPVNSYEWLVKKLDAL